MIEAQIKELNEAIERCLTRLPQPGDREIILTAAQRVSAYELKCNQLTTITVKLMPDGMYWPVDTADRYLLEHCSNDNFIAITKETLDKAVYLAAAHDWKIEIV